MSCELRHIYCLQVVCFVLFIVIVITWKLWVITGTLISSREIWYSCYLLFLIIRSFTSTVVCVCIIGQWTLSNIITAYLLLYCNHICFVSKFVFIPMDVFLTCVCSGSSICIRISRLYRNKLHDTGSLIAAAIFWDFYTDMY